MQSTYDKKISFEWCQLEVSRCFLVWRTNTSKNKKKQLPVSEVCVLQTCPTANSSCLALFSFFFFFFAFLSEAHGTINPTDYSAPLLLDCTFTISRGRQQWGPDESNIHGISFTLLPLSHAPPPLCQAPVWWEGLLTLAAPIDRQFCKDKPLKPYQSNPSPTQKENNNNKKIRPTVCRAGDC